MIDAATEAKFWDRVQVGQPEECWIWSGSLGDRGYAMLARRKASHIALELDGRPRPTGLLALHSCDNPPCVNPRHLRWGTQADNMKDALERGRLFQASRTHCRRGHEYTPENTRLKRVDGYLCRVCRRCHRAHLKAFEQRRLTRGREAIAELARLKDETEHIVSAWAFAHNIDGAARNDLLKRLRALKDRAPTPEEGARG